MQPFGKTQAGGKSINRADRKGRTSGTERYNALMNEMVAIIQKISMNRQGKEGILINGEAKFNKIKELIESGKSKGVLTYKEIMDVLEEIELETEQIERIYDTLESLGIDVLDDTAAEEASLRRSWN